MPVKANSISSILCSAALLSAAFEALVLLAPAAMAQGAYGPGGPGPSGPYYRSQPYQGTSPRPDFPGAKQFNPADPAFLGVGNNRSAAMGMTASGGSPSKEELARHKAYVESLRRQGGPHYKMPQ
jgi:hypothetical protein